MKFIYTHYPYSLEENSLEVEKGEVKELTQEELEDRDLEEYYRKTSVSFVVTAVVLILLLDTLAVIATLSTIGWL